MGRKCAHFGRIVDHGPVFVIHLRCFTPTCPLAERRARHPCLPAVPHPPRFRPPLSLAFLPHSARQATRTVSSSIAPLANPNALPTRPCRSVPATPGKTTRRIGDVEAFPLLPEQTGIIGAPGRSSMPHPTHLIQRPASPLRAFACLIREVSLPLCSIPTTSSTGLHRLSQPSLAPLLHPTHAASLSRQASIPTADWPTAESPRADHSGSPQGMSVGYIKRPLDG